MSSRIMMTVALAVLVLGGCMERSAEDGHGHGHSDEGSDHHDHDAVPRGVHGGRLFADGNITFELRIDEGGGRPIFLGYLYEDGRQFAPDNARVTVTLDRMGGRQEEIELERAAEHFRSGSEVREPHSFLAHIQLELGERRINWSYEQVAFRVYVRPEAVARAGIIVDAAGPAAIQVIVRAPGEIRMNSDRIQIVRPRFPGIVTSMRRGLGDVVSAGDTLAVIQSNVSLTPYAITASMTGRIVSRAGVAGGAVEAESVLYTLADLSTVWADFAIYPQHVGVIRRGQSAAISATTRPDLRDNGKISYVGPLLEQETRASQGRIVLNNPGERWQPGLYVTVDVTVDEATVAVAVPDDAIVRSDFGPAVFFAQGSEFELQPVTIGRSDGQMTEIVQGLRTGDLVVVKNAYLLKAELGKSEATHDH